MTETVRERFDTQRGNPQELSIYQPHVIVQVVRQSFKDAVCICFVLIMLPKGIYSTAVFSHPIFKQFLTYNAPQQMIQCDSVIFLQ